jgi:anti-sigma regulatory factor (Ser/Thr protein kinase)
MTPAAGSTRRATEGFHHEALYYDGPEGFLGAVGPFVREGAEAGEAQLVAVDAWKIDLLKSELHGFARRVRFVDMAGLGGNPARIIPAWQAFVAEAVASGRPFRGVGEPIWPGRSPAELAECHLHESLLNVAFDEGPAWRLVCPYDTHGLDAQVLEDAQRTHPVLRVDGAARQSPRYEGALAVESWFGEPFREPAGRVERLEFHARELSGLRQFVAARAEGAGLPPERVADLVLAANEAATNSLRYGGGGGTLRIWREGDVLICEIRDNGIIEDPMVGRDIPNLLQEGGRGLWMVNQLCDLVQVRSLETGAAVRLHVVLDDELVA